MGKKARNRLDAERLRLAVFEAATALGDELGDGGLKAYLKEIAREKPSAFMNLLLKLTNAGGDVVTRLNEKKKITRIELVALKSDRKKQGGNDDEK